MRSVLALHLLTTANLDPGRAPGDTPSDAPGRDPDLDRSPMDPAAWRAWAASAPEPADPPAPAPVVTVPVPSPGAHRLAAPGKGAW
jgi:hypothetical protein